MKHRIWKRMALGAMAAMLLWATACTEGQTSGGNAADEGETTVSKATITMEDGQQIHMTLDGEQAPITVENFAKLAKEGFYDGLTFHRIEPGFVIQGGDPNGNGTGGPGYQIKGEFSANGVENTISHVRGVVSMARAQDYDSAGSQFFITLDDATFLDGQYAAFGTVDEESMKVVDAIVEQYLQDGKAPVMKSVTVE